MPRELTPLTYDEADEIVHRLVGNDALSADLGARLLASIPLAGPPASGEDVTLERPDADAMPSLCERLIDAVMRAPAPEQETHDA